MISAKLIGYTQPEEGVDIPSSEDIISYCARVSNQPNQSNFNTSERLLKYCIKHKHWSIFEMVSATVEVQAPRDITRQLLRHRSFSFQEFSQRYSDKIEFCDRELRKQDTTNRQNSIDTKEFGYLKKSVIHIVRQAASMAYSQMINKGVAKECARVILPEGLTMSRLYMNGTLRSYIHYLEVRDDPGVTQKEHVELAQKIREVIKPVFPTIFNLDLNS